MNGKKSECVNAMTRNVRTKRLGYRGSWPYLQDDMLCTHQPVPWKRTNAERGGEESFLPDGQRQTYSRKLGWQHFNRVSRYPAAIAVADTSRSQLTSTHCAYPEAPKCWTHFPNDSGPMTSFFPSLNEFLKLYVRQQSREQVLIGDA